MYKYRIYYAYKDNQQSKLLELEYSTLSEVFSNIGIVLDQCLAKLNTGKVDKITTACDLHYTTRTYSSNPKDHGGEIRTLLFDLDAIDQSRKDEYVSVFSTLIGKSAKEIGVISSGGGLHFWLELSSPINATNMDFYSRYRYLCTQLDKGLAAHDLIFTQRVDNKKKITNFDPLIFDKNRTLRLPETINAKYDPPRKCEIINFASGLVNFDELVDKVSESIASTYREKGIISHMDSDVDSFAVQQGCSFLHHYSTHQDEQNFENWHALGLIYMNLSDNEEECTELFHEASKNYPGFDEEVFLKKANSIKASGHKSYSCEKINSMWGGCTKCPHFGKVKSPLHIQGESFIASEKDGFWVQVGTEAKPKYVPDYKGLLKKFTQEQKFILNAGKSIYGVLNKEQGIWEINYTSSMKEFKHGFSKFCQKHLKIPYNRGEISNEKQKFLDFVQSEVCNVTNEEIEQARLIPNCLSFKNGVFNPMTGEYMGDYDKYILTYKLPYSFDKDAKIPDLWLKTLNEWFNGNQNLIDQLGYVFAHVLFDTDYKFHNFHFFFGDGRNGKGLASEVLTELVGGASAIPIKNLIDHRELRPLVKNRLNISNEFNPEELNQSVINRLKDYTGGGSFEHSEKYEVKQISRCVAKFVIVSNDIFKVTAADSPVISRIRVLPFLRKFENQNKDKDLKDKLITPENLSGILNWSAEYGRKLFKLREFPNPPECLVYIQDFQDKSDPLISLATSEYALCPKDLNGSVEKTRIGQRLFFNLAKIYFRETLGIKYFKWKNAPDFIRDFSKVWFNKTGVVINNTFQDGYPTITGFGFDVQGYINGESSVLLTPQEKNMIAKYLVKYREYLNRYKDAFKPDNGFHERMESYKSNDDLFF